MTSSSLFGTVIRIDSLPQELPDPTPTCPDDSPTQEQRDRESLRWPGTTGVPAFSFSSLLSGRMEYDYGRVRSGSTSGTPSSSSTSDTVSPDPHSTRASTLLVPSGRRPGKTTHMGIDPNAQTQMRSSTHSSELTASTLLESVLRLQPEDCHHDCLVTTQDVHDAIQQALRYEEVLRRQRTP